MNTNLIVLDYATILLKLVNNHAVNHQSGLDNIPHLCLKIEHGNGFSWYGMQLLSWDQSEGAEWTPARMEEIHTRVVEELYKMTDVKRVVTQMDRLMLSVKDLLSRRHRPIIIGGDSDVFLSAFLDWNIHLTVYRGEVPADARSYGGFALSVTHDAKALKGFLYHRGVPLNNYISQDQAREFVEAALSKNFPEHYNSGWSFVDVTETVERHRPVNKAQANEVSADSH